MTSTEDSMRRAPTQASTLPWLLPHFEAGTLVELQDGRLRRVLHCCCPVQSVYPSQSPNVYRLLLLPHSQPQRTARLCGLQCRQLIVGDVCLALTPILAPSFLDSETPPGPTGTGRCEKPLMPPGLQTSLPVENSRAEERR
uniref:AXH domain-containing protein n=1 Tax=Knipowitschia caucasica TaxID=637954 RepID=A0AAV2M5S9_KNICA